MAQKLSTSSFHLLHWNTMKHEKHLESILRPPMLAKSLHILFVFIKDVSCYFQIAEAEIFERHKLLSQNIDVSLKCLQNRRCRCCAGMVQQQFVQCPGSSKIYGIRI
jgi:hypothetical protein